MNLTGKGHFIRLIQWMLFLHILAAITFFLAHGTSAAMAFDIRKESDFTRMRAMLDLSWSTTVIMGVAFLVLGLSGLVLPFLLHLWNKIWIWASLVLMVIVFVYMGIFNQTHYRELRRLVGLPYMKGNKLMPAEATAGPEAAAALLKKSSPAPLALIGYVLPAIVLWLIVFKPF